MTAELTDIDHVGIATEDLDAAVELYRRILGMEPAHWERVEDQGVEEVMFAVGSSFIQLLGALTLDTPVGRFLGTHGPGLHHIAYKVGDIERSLDALRAEGVRLIDEHGRPGSRGTKVAFIHPRSMNGVLTELVQAQTSG